MTRGILCCGKSSCSHKACQKKFANKRMKSNWTNRMEVLEDFPLTRTTLTIPGALVARLTEERHYVHRVNCPLMAQLYRKAVRLVDAKLRDAWSIPDTVNGDKTRLFVLGMFHPAGRKNPSALHPHVHVMVPAVYWDGTKLVPVPNAGAIDDDARQRLRDEWASILSALLNCMVPPSTNPDLPVCFRDGDQASDGTRGHKVTGKNARDVIFHDVARAFPGWRFDVRLMQVKPLSGFSARIWNTIRTRLGKARPAKHRLVCTHMSCDCGAKLVPFAELPTAVRDTVNLDQVDEHQRTWHVHQKGGNDCSCECCTPVSELLIRRAWFRHRVDHRAWQARADAYNKWHRYWTPAECPWDAPDHPGEAPEEPVWSPEW